MRIVKCFTFEAAHQLPNHDGACRRLHGHSYKVEVAVEGSIDTDAESPTHGMVMDFATISAAFKTNVFAKVDHQYLNEVLPIPVTTAEAIAGWIFSVMTAVIGGVVGVRVWETATGYAEVGEW